MNQITIMKCLLNQGVPDIYKQKKTKQTKQRLEGKAMKYVF